MSVDETVFGEGSAASDGPCQHEQRMRALELGRSGSDQSYAELFRLLKSPFSDVRRLAASAIGKLAKDHADHCGGLVVPELYAMIKRESHPQALQYALRSLAGYADAAFLTGDLLKDIARDPTRPSYVRKAAAMALSAVQRSARARYARTHSFCTRCRRRISQDEVEAGMAAFGAPYCHHCLEEKQLEDVDFESEVNRAKKLRVTDEIWVQSQGERRIAAFLKSRNIAFVYDERMRMVGQFRIRPDFYLPEFNLYIEYWGMDTPEYLANKARKKVLYRQANKQLISLEAKDLPEIERILSEKLSRYFRL